ncbi:MAG: nucleoside triphosphate pyrophosphohydrolase [Acidobacteria bacterium]|nr:nucleoside triphosphate pyrophosphohydrolase [Acidobacteriota bacterium]
MAGAKFETLLALMKRLRAPDGCPWDREQSLQTLRPYLIEEAYETLDAIERQDWEQLPDELGDLLLQIVFQAQIASEEGLFGIDDVVEAINRKLVRRHPHVFGDETARTAGRVVERWEQIKAEEKRAAAPEGAEDEPAGHLDDVPAHQAALLEALKLGKRAAKVGFDWRNFPELLEKLREETAEIEEARTSGDPDELEDEVGDLLFMCVNIARFVKVNPELALKRANRKFRSRFGYIERSLREQGRSLEEADLDEMEALWQRAKGA